MTTTTAKAKTESATVFTALNEVMRAIKPIAKAQRNSQQGYMFRGVDDLYDALHGPFAEHGIIIIPQVVERLPEQRTSKKGEPLNVVHLHVVFTIYGPAGDSVVADAWGEGQDSADKATSKAATMALKYALLHIFCIPTGDPADDSDYDTTEASADRPSAEASQNHDLAREVIAVGHAVGLTSPKDVLDDFAASHEGLSIREADNDMLKGYLAELRSRKSATEEGAA